MSTVGPVGMQWSSWALRPSITHIVFETTMCKASGVHPCSHPPTHPWIHRSIYPSIHPSIHQPTRLHIPPSVHPWTLERTHARPSIPTSTQPASQPTILASSKFKQSTHQSTKPGNNRSKRPVPAWLLQAACNENCPGTRAEP